jgi:hypothetical protein
MVVDLKLLKQMLGPYLLASSRARISLMRGMSDMV